MLANKNQNMTSLLLFKFSHLKTHKPSITINLQPYITTKFSNRNPFSLSLFFLPPSSPTTSKQLITEERMAAHLNSLHISSNYTSHDTGSCSLAEALDEMSASSSNCSPPSYASIASTDLEQKLRNAQRITICEEIRKLSTDPILPKAILDRFEAPCTALVVWQPPQRLTDLIIPKDEELERKRRDAEQDNNNSGSMNFNDGDVMDTEDL